MSDPKMKTPRGKSPNYPGFNLETAIERARSILQHERDRLVPTGTILEHWGYRPKSSSGLRMLAALKGFGLIDYEGIGKNRRAKLSKLALKILWDERQDSPEKIEAIKEAALNPAIHLELWNSYKGIPPSDQALKIELRQRRFMESAINEFIQQFRETLSFAKLDKNDSISDHGEDKIPLQKEETSMAEDTTGFQGKVSFSPSAEHIRTASLKPSLAVTDREREIANYPAGPGVTIRILVSGEGAITQKSIDKLIKHLELDKEYFPEDESKEN